MTSTEPSWFSSLCSQIDSNCDPSLPQVFTSRSISKQHGNFPRDNQNDQMEGNWSMSFKNTIPTKHTDFHDESVFNPTQPWPSLQPMQSTSTSRPQNVTSSAFSTENENDFPRFTQPWPSLQPVENRAVSNSCFYHPDDLVESAQHDKLDNTAESRIEERRGNYDGCSQPWPACEFRVPASQLYRNSQLHRNVHPQPQRRNSDPQSQSYKVTDARITRNLLSDPRQNFGLSEHSDGPDNSFRNFQTGAQKCGVSENPDMLNDYFRGFQNRSQTEADHSSRVNLSFSENSDEIDDPLSGFRMQTATPATTRRTFQNSNFMPSHPHQAGRNVQDSTRMLYGNLEQNEISHDIEPSEQYSGTQSPVLMGSPVVAQQEDFGVFKVPTSNTRTLQIPGKMRKQTQISSKLLLSRHDSGASNAAKEADGGNKRKMGREHENDCTSVFAENKRKKGRQNFTDPLQSKQNAVDQYEGMNQNLTAPFVGPADEDENFSPDMSDFKMPKKNLTASKGFSVGRTPKNRFQGEVTDKGGTTSSSLADSNTPWRRNDLNPFTPAHINFQGACTGGTKLRSVEEIPTPFRDIFPFPFFNAVQSTAFDQLLYTDRSVVVSAPTGSGKTALFELAIVRLLLCANVPVSEIKVIYIGPMKSLCSERVTDWKQKLSPLGLQCLELTGDSDLSDFTSLHHVQVICTTPEKWDSVTRRWKDNRHLFQGIRLMCVDEVHVVGDNQRGATVEAVITRMKMVHTGGGAAATTPMRFVAASATLPNTEDIAEWLSSHSNPASVIKLGEEYRPVRLQRVVLGYPFTEGSSEFRFDLNLTYKLHSIIDNYSQGKPTLVFCSSRKSCQQTAETLVKRRWGQSSFVQPHFRQDLNAAATRVHDKKLADILACGVGVHHAGLEVQDRRLVEELFRASKLPVLISTSTLSVGVNLPAHLVIVKATHIYVMGVAREYSDQQVLQMIGRAGRPQFDTSATVVIMTKAQLKAKYEALVNGTQVIQSMLHKNLTEHVNVEVVLNTITDMADAASWLLHTLLHVRATKNPQHYGLPSGLNPQQIDQKLQDLCMKAINRLNSLQLVCVDPETTVTTATVCYVIEKGRLMARYCLEFLTMKQLSELPLKTTTEHLVRVLANCSEFSDIQLRTSEKKTLNALNKNKHQETIRYPIKDRIKTRQMKVYCLIQAGLGCLPIQDYSLSQDLMKIFRVGQRVTKCLMELQWLGMDFTTLLHAVQLCKAFKARLWPDSRHVARQFEGIGPTISQALVKSGLTSFQQLEAADAHQLELVANRHPPFGSKIHDAVSHLPRYQLVIQQVKKHVASSAHLVLTVSVVNGEDLKVSATCGVDHQLVVLVGDKDNTIIFKWKLTDRMLLKEAWQRNVQVKRAVSGSTLQFALISLDWAGLDIHTEYQPIYTTAVHPQAPVVDPQPEESAEPSKQCSAGKKGRGATATPKQTRTQKKTTAATPRPKPTPGGRLQQQIDMIHSKLNKFQYTTPNVERLTHAVSEDSVLRDFSHLQSGITLSSPQFAGQTSCALQQVGAPTPAQTFGQAQNRATFALPPIAGPQRFTPKHTATPRSVNTLAAPQHTLGQIENRTVFSAHPIGGLRSAPTQTPLGQVENRTEFSSHFAAPNYSAPTQTPLGRAEFSAHSAGPHYSAPTQTQPVQRSQAAVSRQFVGQPTPIFGQAENGEAFSLPQCAVPRRPQTAGPQNVAPKPRVTLRQPTAVPEFSLPHIAAPQRPIAAPQRPQTTGPQNYMYAPKPTVTARQQAAVETPQPSLAQHLNTSANSSHQLTRPPSRTQENTVAPLRQKLLSSTQQTFGQENTAMPLGKKSSSAQQKFGQENAMPLRQKSSFSAQPNFGLAQTKAAFPSRHVDMAKSGFTPRPQQKFDQANSAFSHDEEMERVEQEEEEQNYMSQEFDLQSQPWADFLNDFWEEDDSFDEPPPKTAKVNPTNNTASATEPKKTAARTKTASVTFKSQPDINIYTDVQLTPQQSTSHQTTSKTTSQHAVQSVTTSQTTSKPTWSTSHQTTSKTTSQQAEQSLTTLQKTDTNQGLLEKNYTSHSIRGTLVGRAAARVTGSEENLDEVGAGNTRLSRPVSLCTVPNERLSEFRNYTSKDHSLAAMRDTRSVPLQHDNAVSMRVALPDLGSGFEQKLTSSAQNMSSNLLSGNSKAVVRPAPAADSVLRTAASHSASAAFKQLDRFPPGAVQGTPATSTVHKTNWEHPQPATEAGKTPGTSAAVGSAPGLSAEVCKASETSATSGSVQGRSAAAREFSETSAAAGNVQVISAAVSRTPRTAVQKTSFEHPPEQTAAAGREIETSGKGIETSGRGIETSAVSGVTRSGWEKLEHMAAGKERAISATVADTPSRSGAGWENLDLFLCNRSLMANQGEAQDSEEAKEMEVPTTNLHNSPYAEIPTNRLNNSPYAEIPTNRLNNSLYAEIPTNRLNNSLYAEIPTNRLNDSPYAEIPTNRLNDSPYAEIPTNRLNDSPYAEIATTDLQNFPYMETATSQKDSPYAEISTTGLQDSPFANYIRLEGAQSLPSPWQQRERMIGLPFVPAVEECNHFCRFPFRERSQQSTHQKSPSAITTEGLLDGIF